MIDIPYDTQLKNKQDLVDQCIGDYVYPDHIIRMKNPDHYRNKVTSVFAPDRKGKPVCGIYREGTHEVIPVKECLLEDLRADRIIQSVYSLLPSFKIRVYDEDRGIGLLKFVQVRTAHVTRQIMVTLVVTSPVFPSRNNFVKALRKLHPEITTIVMNINDKHTTMVLGKREQVLFGKGYIEDQLCGKTFRISSQSFYQVNSIQTEKLYNIAIDYAGLSGKERILDAYCGIGTIGIIASDRCKEVISVELNPDAVKDAVRNAKANDASNVSVYQGDAGKFMTSMAEQGEKLDVLFMDPPRSGSTEEFIRSAGRLAPSKIVYISCNPRTLGRDLELLEEQGYVCRKAVPVDMFPYTMDVETVCLLSKLSEVKNHISVKVDMNEMDLTAAESKATYQEIKEWVKEKYGFHVSHLNIAKTKRKCGIIERKNYNLPKNEDSRSPETPKEKEEAITEAFRHFQMI